MIKDRGVRSGILSLECRSRYGRIGVEAVRCFQSLIAAKNSLIRQITIFSTVQKFRGPLTSTGA